MQGMDGTTMPSAWQANQKKTGSAFGYFGDRRQSLAEVAHDARNMMTALGLYCELLEEPGVLAPSFRHYSGELKLLASASSRLVEKLMALNVPNTSNTALDDTAFTTTGNSTGPDKAQKQNMAAGRPVTDFALELQTNRNLLSALAGTLVDFDLDIAGCALPVRITSEDLTRILVNLVKNAVEAMPHGGRIQVRLRETPTAPGRDPWLLLTVEDNGPGIPAEMQERIFEPGFTTRSGSARGRMWQGEHLGLGLSITRSIVEAAGGHIHAASRDPSGTCFQIELPVRIN